MISEYELANIITGATRAEGGVARKSSATILGKAVEDSENGMVRVVPEGDVFAPGGDNTIIIPTSPSVRAGDTVQIGLVGGVSKRPMVVAAGGEGDRQNALIKIAQLAADEAKEAVDGAVDDIAAIEQEIADFKSGADVDYAIYTYVDDEIGEFSQTVSADYLSKTDAQTTYATQSQLTQKADEITASVSQNYVTKTDAQTTYATKSELTVGLEGVTSEVEANYTTKEESAQLATRIGQTESQISLQAKLIEEADNLLYDTDVSGTAAVNGPAGRYWSDAGNTMISPTFEQLGSADTPKLGIEYAAQFVCDGTQTAKKGRGLRFYNGSGNLIPLAAGQTYTATWWGRCTSGTAMTRVLYNNGVSGSTHNLTSTWKLYTETFTIETLASSVYVWFYCDFPANTAGTAQLCGFRLIAGDSAERVSAELKVTADGIESTVSAISSAKYLVSSNASWTLANIKAWANESTGSWSVVSTEGVRVGDTVYIKGTDTTRNCPVYMVGTVNSIASATSLNMTTHGYVDSIPVNTVISTINQSAEAVKISASKVEIDGAAIFTEIKPQTDATYDAIGSAADAVGSLQVSATNLVRNGDFSNGTNYWVNQTDVTFSTETDSTYGTVLKAVQASAGTSTARLYPDTSTNFTHTKGETYTVSFYAKADAANTIKVDRGYSATEVYLNESIGTSWKRYTGTLKSGGTGTISFSLGSAGTLYLAKVMLVHGSKPMDWSPDPRDVAAGITSAQTTANTANNRSVAYRGANNTASTTAAKTVVCTNFALAIGATIAVYNQASNSVAGPITLNVNGTGAKTVYIGAEATSATNQLLWHIGSTITYTYDGTYWKVADAPSNYYGSSCSTAAGTARKQTTIPAGVIFKGVQLEVPMQYANTHPTPTLAVQNANSTASNLENSILYGTGSIVPLVSNGYSWLANMSVIFRFDGQYWRTGNQTIIDGGNILTGTISADRIAATSIAIGKLTVEAQNAVLNSNIEVGGTNLVMGSGDYNGWIFTNAAVTKSGNILDINVSGQTSNTFYRGRGWLSVPFATLKEIAPTIIVSVEVMSDDWSAVTSDSAAGFASASVQLCTVMGDIGTQTAGETKRYRYMGLNQTDKWQSIPAMENGKWLKFVSVPISVPDMFNADVSKGDGTNVLADVMLRRNGHVKWRNLKVEAGNKATAWSPAPEDDANARKAIYGTCSTAAGTAAKAVTCANFQLFTGARIAVKFSTASTVAAPTLNVNGTGAKAIWYNNAVASSSNPVLWGANATLNFVYDGTEWVLDEKPAGYSAACSTAAGTRDKAATVVGALVVDGTTLALNFSTANTYVAASVRINLSSTGAANVYCNNAVTSTTNTLLWAANTTLVFVRRSSAWYLADSGMRKNITHIDDNGISIHAANNPTTNYIQLNASGMEVFKGGSSVAQFGETARIGQASGMHTEMTSSEFHILDGTSDAFSVKYETTNGYTHANLKLANLYNGATAYDIMSIAGSGNNAIGFYRPPVIAGGSRSESDGFTSLTRNYTSYGFAIEEGHYTANACSVTIPIRFTTTTDIDTGSNQILAKMNTGTSWPAPPTYQVRVPVFLAKNDWSSTGIGYATLTPDGDIYITSNGFAWGVAFGSITYTRNLADWS